MLKEVENVATTDSTVLIRGESGTGKELVARAIHNISNRNKLALVKVNCAALPSELIESELFGHEKGAFTGAVNNRKGRFELADKGTIFLDEIGELPMELQAKLLRAIQEGEFERLGGERTLKVDARIIATTNRNLEEAISKNQFREDLYYRLNVYPIECPPLRERQEDIPLLVQHFLKKYGPAFGKKIDSVPTSVMEKLMSYHWPGNIRELENIVERSMIISSRGKLELGDWFESKGKAFGDHQLISLEDIERGHIVKALELSNWKVSGKNGTAEKLKINPKTLYSRIEKLGIKRR